MYIHPLSADRIDIPNPPLPNTIVNAFKKAGDPLKTFTPVESRK
ncbi:MAG: hypothetical protein AAFV71_13965 [Cyanobacteria bacterium J06633_8]